MNYGETVGIFQGNVISDFLSELLLAYINSILAEKLHKIEIIDYKILRYRDDYRIFANTREDANLIKRELTIVLQRYKLSLGETKTSTTEDIIIGSLKPKKLEWIEKDPVIKITNDKFYQRPKLLFRKSIRKIIKKE